MMKLLLLCLVSIGLINVTHSLPINSDDYVTSDALPTTTEITDEIVENSNETAKNVYVIRAVVYEIGILTDIPDDDNSTDYDDNITHERVDLTFFDAHSNGSSIDLGNIPFPIQTNITGQVLTGLAPIDIGTINDQTDLLHTIPLTGTIFNITQSETSIINLSTTNITLDDQTTYIDQNNINNLPFLSNTIQLLNNNIDSDNATATVNTSSLTPSLLFNNVSNQ